MSPDADDPMSRRDLAFKPVANPAPRVLTAEQIERYNRDGYLMPFPIYNAAGAARNRAYFDRLLAMLKAFKDGRDTYAINGYHTHCRGIWDMVMNPAILDIVEDLVGPDIVCWGTHFFCKLPHDPKSVPWHQDASYWPFTPARTITVWLAIDDTDTENACMSFLPGTHRLGHLAWKRTDKPAVLNQEIEEIGKYGRPVPVELKAGEIELHADMLAHGSPPNTSSRRRCGLTMRYCPTSVRSVNGGWRSQAILCRGRDPDAYWTPAPRPDGEDLAIPAKRKELIGAN